MRDMDSGQKPIETVIVSLPEMTATGMIMMVDVLSSVGRDWELLHGRTPLPPAFSPMMLSLDGEPFLGPNGVIVTPHGALSDRPAPDIVIVPDIIVDLTQPYPNSYNAVVDWIRAAYQTGAIICSVCSGSLLLAEAGLLDGKDAATHWGYASQMSARYPKVRVRRERILIPAGEGHRIISAGGASSWHDLLLYLIGRFVSSEEARRIAKIFLLQWHSEGQLPFASLTVGRQHEDQLIAAAQIWAAENYPRPNPVAEMAARSGLTERSFLRRFRAATGQSPLEYIQTLRMEEAKQMLETSDMSLDNVAAEVGYVEPASFRRLFRKLVGLTPSDYRRRSMPPPELRASRREL
jgi:transcriptional regulator GlxA family with amidase domain